jgi:hypothetical protein
MSNECKLLLALFLICGSLAVACFLTGVVMIGSGVVVGMTTTSAPTTNPPSQPFDPSNPSSSGGQSTTQPGQTRLSGIIAIIILLFLAAVFLLLALLFAYLAQRLFAEYQKSCPQLMQAPTFMVPSSSVPATSNASP